MSDKNIYHESNEVFRDLKKGDIAKITYPSGNWDSYRVHGHNNGKLVVCDMGWDNLVTEEISMHEAMFELIKRGNAQ